MSLSPAFLDELRSRISLAALVGRKVTWDRRKSSEARGDFWAPCPFHQEKTASFHVDEAKGFYHCFGCHASGDAIKFLRETENIGFMEAVEALALEAGMSLPDRGASPRQPDDRRTRLQAATEAAVAFYRLQLSTARAAAARAYLDGRGITPAMRERFDIGFAPAEWTALADHLGGKGFSLEELASAGLTGTSPDGRRSYDRFRNRIIFPIRDGRGRAVALGGRTLATEGDAPKYLNSPETPLFDKGRTLFNLRAARAAVAKGAPLLVAEGYIDVVALVQAGFEGAVAPLGTAITEDQLDQLWAVAPEPLVALDGDDAGLAAAQRLIDRALPRLVAGRSLRFVLLPARHDPDDVIRTGGAAAMQALIDESQPIAELLWRRETEGERLDSPERRAALDARLKAHLARIKDEGLRAHWWADLRERRTRLFAPPASVSAARAAAGGRPATRRGKGPYRGLVAAGASAAAKASLLARSGSHDAEARIRESAILLGLINHPSLLPVFEDRLDRMPFACPDLAKIRDALLSAVADALPVAAEAGLPPATPEETASVACAASPQQSGFADAIARRLGSDPRGRLFAIDQVRDNPHLRPEGDLRRAQREIEEKITRHAVWLDQRAEREAIPALGGDGVDESLTWRLRAFVDAEHDAARAPFVDEEEPAESQGQSLASRLLAEGAFKKLRKR